MSQGQLAERVGVNQATVSRLEGGQRQFQELAAESLFRLADALGVSVEHFRPYFAPPPPAAAPPGPVAVVSKRK